MLQKRWFGYISAYVFWAISLAMAAWFLIQARVTFPGWIAGAIIQNPVHAQQLALILDRITVLVGGSAWLVLLIVIEQYFRKGIPKGNLWRRIARVVGILLVLIFVVDSCRMIQGKLLSGLWLSWLILILELALGTGLLYLSRNRRLRPRSKAQYTLS